MIYRLLKKPLGIARIDNLFEINLDFRIIDICYVPDFGFFFLTQNTHCLGLFSLKGELQFPWAGQINDKGENDSLFESPSSLCYFKRKNEIIIVDNNGKRIRNIQLPSTYIQTTIQGVELNKLPKYFSRIRDTSTSCDTDQNNIYWTVKNINRIFKYDLYRCEVDVYMGNGKGIFATSNDLKNCSLNMPSGIKCFDNNIYVCDSGNHCIRVINNSSSHILAGIPTNKGDNDAIAVKSLLSFPTKPRMYNGVLYFIDGKKIKALSLKDKTVTTIKTFEKELLIEVSKDLYMLEML